VEVLDHVASSISPASTAHGEAAERAVAGAAAPQLARVARILGQAQRVSVPRVQRRVLVIVAADAPAADPGITLGPAHPTVVAASAIADGTAAVSRLARTHATPILLVDAGVREPDHVPASVVRLAGIEAGIALSVSLSEDHDVVALGALGLGESHADVMVGLILGLASVQIPVILDGYATVSAASAASRIAPDVRGYLIASQGAPRALLDQLGLVPIFAQGIGHGEGVAAAMVMPLLDQVAALAGGGYKGLG
jgi:NaMN:DMB phosphoribosyltransferase